MSTTVRVSTTTRDRLAAMAETAGRPMTSIIDEALDAIEAERAEESAVLHDAQT
jgi:predicted transcriptional regulator